MKEVFDQYVESTLGADSPTEYTLRLYDTNYRSILPLDKNAKILDIGVGVGGLLMFLRDCGYVNSRGVDISSSTIRSCQKKGLNCELVADTTEWLNSHADEFDFITLLDVIEHIPKKEIISFLSAIRRSMKATGVLLIQTNNMQAEYAQIMRYGDITHEVGYCETSLRQVCIVAGFKAIDLFGLETLYACKSWRYFKQIPLKAVQHFVCTYLRNVYWLLVHTLRRLNCNYSPNILHPMFYALVRK